MKTLNQLIEEEMKIVSGRFINYLGIADEELIKQALRRIGEASVEAGMYKNRIDKYLNEDAQKMVAIIEKEQQYKKKEFLK